MDAVVDEEELLPSAKIASNADEMDLNVFTLACVWKANTTIT